MKALLVAISVLLSPQTEAADKPGLLKSLHFICEKNDEAMSGACDCLKANYELRFSAEELILLLRIHEGKSSAEEMEAHPEVTEFDAQAGEKCRESGKWRWAPPAAKPASQEKKPLKPGKPRTKPKT